MEENKKSPEQEQEIDYIAILNNISDPLKKIESDIFLLKIAATAWLVGQATLAILHIVSIIKGIT